MATVYLAEDVKHHRQVAIKVLHPEVAGAVGPERFVREIEIAARLNHPHILPLYDSGEVRAPSAATGEEANGERESYLFYVMPYVEGESLAQKLAREGELPVDETVRILRDVADALAKAHSQGVVHRDIKPGNVLLADRHALVADFGVARAVSSAAENSSITQAGVALGTPAYMAPEQASADPHVDHRADIYALGCMAYEMLAGTPPFTGHSTAQILAAHMTAQPVPVRTLRAAVPEALASLVMRCLEKKPADRWQSATELVTQLETILTPPGGSAPARPARSRSRTVALGAIAGAVMIAVAWLAFTRLGDRQAVDPDLVVVLPFRVTSGDERVTVLREGMLDLMATYLTGEGGTPRAADPATVMTAWRERVASESTDLSEPDAVALARTIGAGRALMGSIVQSGERLVVRGTLVAVEGESEPAQATVEGPMDSLMVLLPRFVGQVLVQSAGITADVSESLTTRSMPALRAYLRGQAAYRRGRYGDAVNRYTEALESDSTFALAGVGLITANSWSGTATPHIIDIGQRAAWNGRNRLSERDRALVVAVLGPGGLAPSSRRDFLRAREEAVRIAPDRADVWYYLGDEYFHDGALLGFADALPRAEAALRRAVALDSTVSGPIEHLMLLASLRRDTTEMRRLIEQLERIADPAMRAPYVWFAGVILGDTAKRNRALATMAADIDGRLETRASQIVLPFMTDHVGELYDLLQRELQETVTQQERDDLAAELAMLELDMGRPRVAMAHLPRDDRPETLANAIMIGLFWDGDTTEAARAARRLAAMGGGPTDTVVTNGAPPACAFALWSADHGAAADAERAIARLRQSDANRDPTWPPSPGQVCAMIVDAIIAQRQARPSAAQLVDSLERVLLTVPYRPLTWENLALARLLEGRGEYARAAAAASRHHLLWSWLPFYATHLHESGRLFELAGNRERAIDAYRTYLAIRSDPEPSVAADVADVRQRLERLTSELRSARK